MALVVDPRSGAHLALAVPDARLKRDQAADHHKGDRNQNRRDDEETFDLLLRPLPKTQKLSTLAVPVDIEGTFAEPSVSPRTGTAVAQAARGVRGGLLIPLNQITALFGQETADACADALRQAQERQQQQATERRSPS